MKEGRKKNYPIIQGRYTNYSNPYFSFYFSVSRKGGKTLQTDPLFVHSSNHELTQSFRFDIKSFHDKMSVYRVGVFKINGSLPGQFRHPGTPRFHRRLFVHTTINCFVSQSSDKIQVSKTSSRFHKERGVLTSSFPITESDSTLPSKQNTPFPHE